MQHTKRFSVVLSLILLTCALAFSADYAESSWELVIDGVSVSEPQLTRWGFVTVTDGRTLYGWTEDGDCLFQRKLNRRPSEMLVVNYADFIYLVSGDFSWLSMFNPDGRLVWEKQLPSHCSSTPVCGRDGRIFVPVADGVMCFSIHGNVLWHWEPGQTDVLTMYEKSDGSLLINGLFRLSPFGELLSDTADTIPLVGTAPASRTYGSLRLQCTTGPHSGVTAFSQEGIMLWSRSFAENVDYILTTDRTIMTVSQNWVISGYRYSNTSTATSTSASSPILEHSYTDRFSNGTAERQYASLLRGLKSIISNNGRISVNPEIRNIAADMDTMMNALQADHDISDSLSEIILSEQNTGILQLALCCVIQNGYDPDGKIMNAISTRIQQRHAFQFEDSIYALFCDAVSSICSLNGTKIRMARGMQLVNQLFSPDYSDIVQDHAAAVLDRLIRLQIAK